MCPVRAQAWVCLPTSPKQNLHYTQTCPKSQKKEGSISHLSPKTWGSQITRPDTILLSICTYSLHGKKSLVGWWYFIWQISRLKWSSSSSAGKFCNFENWEENGKNVGQSTFLHEIVVISCCLIKIVHCSVLQILTG